MLCYTFASLLSEKKTVHMKEATYRTWLGFACDFYLESGDFYYKRSDCNDILKHHEIYHEEGAETSISYLVLQRLATFPK